MREEALSRSTAKSRLLGPHPAAQATCRCPSRCSSSSSIQFFGVPCRTQKDPRYLQALLRCRSYFRHRRTARGLLRCHFPSCFSWIGPVVYSSFILIGAVKIQVTLHGTSLRMDTAPSNCAGTWEQRDGGLRQENSPSWSSPMALQVHPWVRGGSLTRLEGEKPKGFKSRLIVRRARNIFPNQTKWKKQIFARMKVSNAWQLSLCFVSFVRGGFNQLITMWSTDLLPFGRGGGIILSQCKTNMLIFS